MNIFYSILMISSLIYSWNLRDLNPFGPDIIEQITPYEYPCNAQVTIVIEGPGELDLNTWKHDRAMIQVKKSGTREAIKKTQVHIEHDATQITIKNDLKTPDQAALSYTLMVPEKAHVRAHMRDSIKMRNTAGPVHALSYEHNIKILHAQNSVFAHAPQGKVTVKQRTLPADASIFIDAYKNARLALSRNHNASIHAKSPSLITVDLFVTIDPTITKITQDTWQRLMHDIKLTLGDGGPSVSIESRKGKVALIEQ